MRAEEILSVSRALRAKAVHIGAGLLRQASFKKWYFLSTVRCMRVYRKRLRSALLCLIALLFPYLPAFAQTVPTPPEDEKALNAATQDLCNFPIVMLGEIATHGDGHTIAFKVALVERLVNQCGFNAVFFEANQDEFLHLNQRLRSGESVTSDDLLSAVGGIWRFYREFQPLAPFLLARARSGKLILGGLDDQLGQFGQSYANADMIKDLTNLLPQPEKQNCMAALHKRIYSDYSEASPYSKPDRSKIGTCLAEIHAASDEDTTSTDMAKEEREEMISATQRWVGRDFSSEAENRANRDRSMFQTFEWLQSRLPKKHKVIIWAATVHIAKRGDPNWGEPAGTNLGSFLHRGYGGHIRSIGFSALTGSFRQGKGEFLTIPAAPPDSVEAQALQGTDTTYVSAAQLAKLGTRPGAFFFHAYQTLAWSDFLDGVVVFRTEQPPSDTR